MVSLSSAQLELLKALYVKFDIPVDRFITQRDELGRLVEEFNRQGNLSVDEDEILHFMMNQRKCGRWPRIRREYFGRDAKRAS